MIKLKFEATDDGGATRCYLAKDSSDIPWILIYVHIKKPLGGFSIFGKIVWYTDEDHIKILGIKFKRFRHNKFYK